MKTNRRPRQVCQAVLGRARALLCAWKVLNAEISARDKCAARLEWETARLYDRTATAPLSLFSLIWIQGARALWVPCFYGVQFLTNDYKLRARADVFLGGAGGSSRSLVLPEMTDVFFFRLQERSSAHATFGAAEFYRRRVCARGGPSRSPGDCYSSFTSVSDIFENQAWLDWSFAMGRMDFSAFNAIVEFLKIQ